MKKLVFFAVLSLWLQPSFSQPTIYQDDGYRGQSCNLGCSESNLHHAGWGDKISSISVPSGYVVVFFEHTGFRGASFTVYGNESRFGDYGWNDKASSAKVYYYGDLQERCDWIFPTRSVTEPREVDHDYHGRH